MTSYMRNTQTGEIRTVEDGSVEIEELRRQVSPNGLNPLWEQTGAHDAQATVARATTGKTLESDLGEEFATTARETVEAPTFVDPAPWSNLTPGEIEMGLTPEDKREQLETQLAGGPVAQALSKGADAILGGDGDAVLPTDVDTPAPSAAENAGATEPSGTTNKSRSSKSSKSSGSSSSTASTSSSTGSTGSSSTGSSTKAS